MDPKPDRMRQLVILTAAAALLFIIVAGALFRTPPTSFAENDPLMTQQPLIGSAKAPVELVLIEDLHCSACRNFTQTIFPKISQDFIKTGQAHCIVIPIAFSTTSQILANAALAVNHWAPDRFEPYLHALFDHFDDWNETDPMPSTLLELAKQVGGIPLKEVSECIEKNCFAEKLEENFLFAQKVMGERVGTPALYIKRQRVSTSLFESIAEQIKFEQPRSAHDS